MGVLPMITMRYIPISTSVRPSLLRRGFARTEALLGGLPVHSFFGGDDMTARNRRRGYELEKETVDFWKEQGIACERVFASGAYKRLGKDFEGDLKLDDTYVVECKRRKTGSGFKFLYDALEQDDADLLVLRADRERRLYVLEEDTVLHLLKRARSE